MDLAEKIKANRWDTIDDFLRVLQGMREGKWQWLRNSRCKYVELRVDMRDGSCVIRDRHGNRIDPKDLEYQYDGREQAPANNQVERPGNPVRSDAELEPHARHNMKTGIELIAAERQRQITDEGCTPEHDDAHDNHQLSEAAACYALGVPSAVGRDGQRVPLWPWAKSWWKPGDRVRDLVKAGALIAAEIDRLQRLGF